MKVLYLIDSKEFKYHSKLAEDFLSVIEGEVMDLCDEETREAKYHDIQDYNADLIITFDGVGLGYRTVTDTLSLNNIYARMAHILFHKTSFYTRLLSLRQNLSMYTFIPCTEDEGIVMDKYPDVPNILRFPEIFYKADNDGEHSINRQNIRLWWDWFRREAML